MTAHWKYSILALLSSFFLTEIMKHVNFSSLLLKFQLAATGLRELCEKEKVHE